MDGYGSVYTILSLFFIVNDVHFFNMVFMSISILLLNIFCVLKNVLSLMDKNVFLLLFSTSGGSRV